MKLAEALALRAEATRRIEQLRGRIVDNARYQDGEEPAEDAASLLAQTGEACAELESLIRRINRTNAVARLGAGTITDAIARRDMLKLRHSVITAAADAAAGRECGWSRQLRSELTFISALPVADLRAQADDVARRLRELDTDIQRTNWEADLLDE
jgi:threonine aldolase